MSTTGFTDNGGLVLQNINVHLIFWGTGWTNVNISPTLGRVADAIENILVGPYMSKLTQYRSIKKGRLNGITLVTRRVGNSADNPPNPFTNANVQGLITDLVNSGLVPNSNIDPQLFYCVIMPPKVRFNNANVIGEHTYFVNSTNQNVHFAWVTNNGTLDNVTTIFSHELVETCTDPEGTAILGTPGTCQQGGWCEIGDVCTTTGSLNGVVVQSYWSQNDKACIIPTTKDDKDSKDGKDGKDNKEHKDHKEAKDGAKEKDKDAKEKDRDTVESLSSIITEISQRVGNIEQELGSIRQAEGTGKAFILPEERPKVGGQVLSQSSSEKGGQVLSQ